MDDDDNGSSRNDKNVSVDADNGMVPSATTLCIAIGLYTVVLLIALAIRKYMKTEQYHCNPDPKCSCRPCSSQIFSGYVQFKEWICTTAKCNRGFHCCSCYHDILAKNCIDTCLSKSSSVLQCGHWNCKCSFRLPRCESIDCGCFEIIFKK